jgi:hypothetical protein
MRQQAKMPVCFAVGRTSQLAVNPALRSSFDWNGRTGMNRPQPFPSAIVPNAH